MLERVERKKEKKKERKEGRGIIYNDDLSVAKCSMFKKRL